VKAYLRHGKGYQLDQVCLMIAGWEGPPSAIDKQERAVLSLLRNHGGFDLGHTAGDTWFARKYEYPLLRDLLMERGAIVDVTETAVLWKDLFPLYDKVGAALREECAHGEHPGYVGCHLSHVYPNGVCLYFTFVTMPWGEDAMTKYLRIKKRAVDTLVAAGAAISHHHSIGYEHQPWMADYVGPTGLKTLQGLKSTLDPQGLCNPGKLIPSPASGLDKYWPVPPRPS
jgi:alkyldihydroxyacetonephosphate synthase